MRQRLLFVAGMTVGVVAPIVWGSYVSRPGKPVAAPPTSTLALTATAGAAPNAAPMPLPTAIKTPVEAIPSTSLRAPEVTTTASIPSSVQRPAYPVPPDPPKPRQAQAPSAPKPEGRRHVAQHPHERQTHTVVSRYIGPHVIVICDALTARQKHYAGCP